MTRVSSAMARLALIAAATILATLALGWAGPRFIAVVLAALDGRSSVPREAGTAAALGWLIIIGFTLVSGGTRAVGLVGGALGMPAFVLPLASILFAAGLAWSAATLVALVRFSVVSRRRAAVPTQPGLP